MFDIKPYIQIIKIVAIAIAVAIIIWFYKDWQYQKEENIRQTENVRQLRMSDSLRFTSQILTERELKEYLEYNNKDLKKLLQESNIRENRIQSLISNEYRYQDKTAKGYDISGLIAAINQKKELTVPFADSTKCMFITGNVTFKNDSLKVNITDRQFKNKTDNVVFWERNQWSFLGIKTRFLGKKQFTAKTFDQCGESKIMRIEKKK